MNDLLHACHGYPPGECYCTHEWCDGSTFVDEYDPEEGPTVQQVADSRFLEHEWQR